MFIEYTIKDWEFDKTKRIALEKKAISYDRNHKTTGQRKGINKFTDVPLNIDPNFPLVFNALADFSKKYLK